MIKFTSTRKTIFIKNQKSAAPEPNVKRLNPPNVKRLNPPNIFSLLLQRKTSEKVIGEIKIVLTLRMKENVIHILCVFIIIEREGNQVAGLEVVEDKVQFIKDLCSGKNPNPSFPLLLQRKKNPVKESEHPVRANARANVALG